MNSELKEILNLILDCIKVEQDIEHGAVFLFMIPQFISLASEITGVIQGLKDVNGEVSKLQDPSVQSDLVAFIQGKFKEVLPGDKAQNILNASIKLIQDVALDVLALEKAIHG